MRVGSLFSGIGLLDYGLHLAGFEHAWLCEREPDRRAVLQLRFPGVPVYDDVRAVGAGAARPDVIAGGFPCKGVSSAGPRTGFGHPETALWREQLRVIRELRPRYVLVENVADLLTLERGELFGEVLGGLASCGYDAEWDCFPAAAFGAPHGRDRVFLTAVADSAGARADAYAEAGRPRGTTRERGVGAPADPDGARRSRGRQSERARSERDGHLNHEVAAETAAVADQLGRGNGAQRDRGAETGRVEVGSATELAGRSVAVGWGKYEPAVQRWEDIIGWPAPEPLVRRVDDGRTTAMERSRLSALGDGVLVQAGWFVGARLMEHALTLCDPAEERNSHSVPGEPDA